MSTVGKCCMRRSPLPIVRGPSWSWDCGSDKAMARCRQIHDVHDFSRNGAATVRSLMSRKGLLSLSELETSQCRSDTTPNPARHLMKIVTLVGARLMLKLSSSLLLSSFVGPVS
jgi:hypothetical protein